LEEAVTSVLIPFDEQVELILVDNWGDEAAKELARSMSASDNRIKLIYEPLKGIVNALNTGLLHCQGEYIARMDADDISLPGRLRMQMDFLQSHPEVGLISGLVVFSESGHPSEGYKLYTDFINSLITNEQIQQYRFVESPIAHPSVMFRRNLIEKLGGYATETGIPEDYELWLRWLEHGVIMEKLPVPVLVWRDSPDRLSRNDKSYSSDAFSTVRMRYLIKWLNNSKEPMNRPIWIWGAGKYARRKAAFLESSGLRFEGYIDITDKSISGKHPVIHFNNLPPPGTIFVISLVSNRGKPLEIETFLKSRGYQSQRDFVICG